MLYIRINFQSKKIRIYYFNNAGFILDLSLVGGALPIFITVYIPFFVVSALCYDWQPKVQRRVIEGLFAVDALMMILFAGVLR